MVPERRLRRALMLLLALVLAVPVPPAVAVPIRPTLSSAAVLRTTDGIDGSDACGLLTDEELLQATGATAVLNASPGSQMMMSAGCAWQLEAPDPIYSPWELWVGVEPAGGLARFESDLAFMGEPRIVGGIGDRAFVDFTGSWMAVKGDTAVSVQYLGFGGAPRPSAFTGRALTWLIMQRIEGGGTAVGPTPSPGPSAPPVSIARALVERVRSAAPTDDTVAATMEILARAGVGTYADPTAAEPMLPIEGMPSPMVLLHDQVRAMALEAWAGGGIAGVDMDGLVPVAPDLAPPSWVLAGYVAAAETEGAQVARELLGAIDWSQPELQVFPQLVLTLFTADLVREQQTLAAAAGVAVAPVAPHRALALVGSDGVRTAQGGLCSAAQNFLNGALDLVFNALRLGEATAGPVIAAIWNFVVGLAEKAARNLVKELTQPVLDLIGQVAATAGMVATIVSAIRPWTMTVAAEPAVTRKGVGGSPGQPGQLVVRIDLGGFDRWPPHVEDCARVAGHPLPNLKPEGAPVTWDAITQSPGGLIMEGQRQARLDADGVAKWDFVTGVDTLPEPWQERAGTISVRVTVERPELEDLRRIAVDELFSLLPTIVRGVLEPYLRAPVEQLAQKLTLMISQSASGPGTVIHHVPAETPEPGATPPPTPRPAAVMVVVDRPGLGDAVLPGRTIELVSCSGPYGPWSGVLRAGGMVNVPFAELPLAFSFRGSGGVQRTRTTTSGLVPTSLPSVAFDVTFDLDITVDGQTMTLAISGSAGEMVQGAPLFEVGATAGTLARPIEPAPAGTC